MRDSHSLMLRIRQINKPVFADLNNFINDNNIKATKKRELTFDFPPITFSDTIQKLIDEGAINDRDQIDEGKLADMQVKELWRLFGKYIYGGGARAYTDNGEEVNQLKILFNKYQERVGLEKQLFRDFSLGRKVSV